MDSKQTLDDIFGATAPSSPTSTKPSTQETLDEIFGGVQRAEVKEAPKGGGFMSFIGELAKSIAKPFVTTGVTGLAAIEGAGRLIGGDVAGAEKRLKEGYNVPGFGQVAPVGATVQDGGFGTEAKRMVGTGAEIASFYGGGQAVKGLSLAKKIGTGIKEGALIGGVGGAGATASEGDAGAGDIIAGGVAGAGLGAVAGAVTPLIGAGARKAGKAIERAKEPLKTATEDAASVYREVLRPTAGEIKNIEIRKGKKIDDYYKIMADEGVPIERTADNKLDTLGGIEALDSKIEPLHESLTTVLASKPNRTFSLLDIAEKAKKEIMDQKGLSATTKKGQIADVDEYIQDEIASRFGDDWQQTGNLPNVDAPTLNEIKQGLWREGYRADKPTAQATARKLGHLMKETIEDAFKGEQDVAGLNQRIADLIQSKTLLQNAQGRVVRGGALGNMAAGTVGSIVGSTLNVPVLGPVAGKIGGEAIQSFLTDPARLTAKAASNVSKAKVKQAKLPKAQAGEVTGQIVDDPLISEARKYKSADEFVKAQGTSFHGTNTVFERFSKDKLGKSTGAKSAEKGFWFTDNQDIAKGYGEYSNDRKVTELLDQVKIAERNRDWNLANKLNIKAEELSAEYSDPVVISAKLNLANPMIYDAKGKGFLATDKKVNDLIDQAISNGNDGLIIKNLVDNVYYADTPSTHTIVFDENKILTKSQLTDIWNKANKK